MSRPLALSAVLILIGLSAADADAHTRMTNPTPRSSSDGLKTGPCGNVARGTDPLVVSPGQTMTVSWLETVNHPGYYRIALSPAGDVGFDDNILADDIADVDCTLTPCDYSQEITFPETECEDCTLQLIQFMGTAAPYSPYFSCADLRIAAGGGGGEPDGGPTGGDDGGADAGCQVSGGGGGGLTLGCLMSLGLLLVTNARRKRSS